MPVDTKLWAKLSNAFGPSGNEEEIRSILKKELNKYSDEVKVDKLGNIFFFHHGKEEYPTIMLAAHMDEVAFLVTFIEENGFLRFQTIGGITSNIMLGHTILLRGSKRPLKGVIGTKPPHIMTEEERKQILPMEDLFLDIGAENQKQAKEKGARIGTRGVFDIQFTRLGDGFVSGKAFDDRAGCAVLAEVFKSLKDSPYNVVAVGTVQEEVGLRGARTAAWQIEPDFGLALEGTFAADVPGSRPDRVSAKLKGGPVVTIMDRTTITHPKILNTLMRLGEEKSIPYQFKKVPTGGTDAGAIHVTKAGIPSGTIAVPCRYIHAPASIAHIDDFKHTVALATEFVKEISKLEAKKE
ncbi:MAG: M42 family metallopeptidase [Candidatus Bathyarchaeota archaeon]